MKINFDNLCAIILAGGKGTRMNSDQNADPSLDRFRGKNKVTYEVAGKPIILRILDKLTAANINNIIVVVSYAKESVINIIPNNIKIAEQQQPMGTGDAVKSALPQIPANTENVLVLYGDDAFWYSPENFQELYNLHLQSNAAVTFCTTVVENPTGLGRIIRDENQQVIGIVEEKNTTPEQKKITEVNLGGFIFNTNFLKQNIDQIPQNEISGEYYLTDMIDIAVKQNKKIETLKLKNFTWRGINTPEELKAAEQLLS